MSEERKIRYENGQLRGLEFYQNGIREGKSKWWYINGRPEVCEFYRYGRLEGITKWWLSNGQLFSKEFYWSGMLIDCRFNQREYAFRRLKHLYIGKSSSFTSFLISDLLKLAGNI
jgi:hypothetical protein